MNDLDYLLDLLMQIEQESKYNKIKFFKFDTWQRKAIQLGKTERVRGIICGNR